MVVPHYAPSMVDSRHVYAREKYLASMNNIIQWNCLTINLIEIILLIQTLLPIAFCPQVSQLKKSDHITYTPSYTVYNTYDADEDKRDTVGSAILVRIKFKFVRNAYYCVCLLLVPYIDEIENLNCSTNAVMFSYFITFLAWNWSWQLSSWSWSYSSWICNYLCNQCLKLWVRNHVSGEVYSIQHYMVVGGFLLLRRFLSLIKLAAMI